MRVPSFPVKNLWISGPERVIRHKFGQCVESINDLGQTDKWNVFVITQYSQLIQFPYVSNK